MAYRRKQSLTRSSTFEDHRSEPSEEQQSPPSSLAAKAIRASSQFSQESTAYEYTSMKSLNESKDGFWGVLARKAKSILEDDNAARQFADHGTDRPQMLDTSTGGQFHQSHWSPESYRKTDNPIFHKGPDAIASSLNYIGGTIRNALEEGLTIVENRTADIIQETRKLQIRRKSSGSGAQNQATVITEPQNLSQSQTDRETQLKASRDVANAMAAKAKLLLRELKSVKADLAFAKERCTQLEEENRIFRDGREKGDNPEDDDLIRLQMETLLAEKGRLAHENSVYARENRFLREIVEYHQLTMQDFVYLDQPYEEVHHSPPHFPPHQISSPPIVSTHSTPTSSPPSPIPDASSFISVSPPPPVVTEAADTVSSPSLSPTAARRLRSQIPP